MHIPNYEGCFFIEKTKELDIGTELKLYLNNGQDNKRIASYIEDIMLDIKYDLSVDYLSDKVMHNIDIPAHNMRKNVSKNNFILFVPLSEDFNAKKIDYAKDVISGQFTYKYEHGILIYNTFKKNNHIDVLNAGILVQQASLSKLFGKGFENEYSSSLRDGVYYKNNMIANFPSNWIQLDVSREKLVGFSDDLKKMQSKKVIPSVGVSIAESLLDQIQWILNHSETAVSQTPVTNLNEAIHLALDFCNCTDNGTHKNLSALKCIAHIIFSDDAIIFALVYKGNNKDLIKTTFSESIPNKIIKDLLKKFHTLDFKNEFIMNISRRNETSENHSMFLRDFYRLCEDFIMNPGSRMNASMRFKCERTLLDPSFCELDQGDDILKILALLFLSFLDNKDDLLMRLQKKRLFIPIIERILMERIKICDIEKESKGIEIKYTELKGFLESQNQINTQGDYQNDWQF